MKTSAAAVLMTASAVASSAQQASPDLLADLHHRARPFLIFAGAGDARVAEQFTALRQHAAESNDRQLHVILLSDTPLPHDDGSGPEISVATAAEQLALRKRFHVAPGTFAVVLVGKDGGEKLRSDRPISWERLQSTIDAMPMRQQESRGKAR
jgi:hypothetical protein